MFRISKMGNTYYAVEIKSVELAADDITALAENDGPVIVAEDLGQVAEILDIDVDDIKISN